MLAKLAALIRSLIVKLSDLSQNPPFSWGVHAVLAVPLTFLFGPGPVIVFYVLREVEQALHEYGAVGYVVDPRDHVIDVLAPAAAAGLYTFLFL